MEGETIQASLKTIENPSSIAEISKKFKQYMAKGNINLALKLLANSMENGISPLNKDTLSKLIQKYPKGKTASQDILLLLNGTLQNIHPVKFQSINEEMIRKQRLELKEIQVHQIWMMVAGAHFYLPIILEHQVMISVSYLQM